MKYIIIFLIVGILGFPDRRIKSATPFYSLEQLDAFKILSKKCNGCHQIQNPSKVFTIENMDGFYKKINRQVFFWKRMPKGGKIKLSKEEKRTLKNWINTLK